MCYTWPNFYFFLNHILFIHLYKVWGYSVYSVVAKGQYLLACGHGASTQVISLVAGSLSTEPKCKMIGNVLQELHTLFLSELSGGAFRSGLLVLRQADGLLQPCL